MRKSRKKILNQLLAVTLSVSMGAPNIVAMADPVIDDPDGGTKTELLIDDEKVSDKDTQGETKDESKDETENESKDETKDESKDESKDETKDESKDETKDETENESKDETKDETKDESKDESKDETKGEAKNESNKTLSEKVEDVINGITETVTGKKNYKKFGTDEFILWWFEEASDEEKAEWYASISKYDEDKATDSDAKYPAFSSDEFDDWFDSDGTFHKFPTPGKYPTGDNFNMLLAASMALAGLLLAGFGLYGVTRRRKKDEQ